ncbi:hypothetical protein EW145_g6098 [Phellinidium pouzarii]|uniref:DUF659 domain-containing protein n=1 Tax=Phellinidium pouzarii TaxID=167371 RepID=A0A4S4KXZ2_9AGAM|nr:hypothetical protein EW145_g6098 [Phellinidium pouzarii]
MSCNYCTGSSLLHRDNRLLNHISDRQTCPTAPVDVHELALQKIDGKKVSEGNSQTDILKNAKDMMASEEVTSEASSLSTQTSTGKKRKLANATLTAFLEKPLDEKTSEEYDRKVLHFLIHANVAFNVAEDDYFIALLYALWPMYKPPSRYVLSHTILDAEAARVHLLEMEQLQERKFLTMMADGWEDAAGRSIYGVVAAEVKKDPVVLGLSDLTGQQATAGAVVTVCNENMAKMDLKARQSAALCTDNPTTMIAAHRLWVETYTWMIAAAGNNSGGPPYGQTGAD